MKRVTLILLVLAAGCGSAATSHTVTAPVKTRVVYRTPDECRVIGLKLVHSGLILTNAANAYVHLILPAYKAGVYGSSVDQIVAKENAATKRVQASTRIVHEATALVGKCFG